MAKHLSLDSSLFHVQMKHILPNAVTILALCSGMTALILAADGKHSAAILCILLAALLDACDGYVARITGGSSKFGAELDSLSDVVCFGAVPAFIVFKALLHPYGIIGLIVCMLFLAACALRLARFNVATADPAPTARQNNFFSGIPAPAGAYLVLAPLYVILGGLASEALAATLALVMTPVFALLMVSRIPTFSSKSIRFRTMRNYGVPAVLIAALGFHMLDVSWWSVLAAAGLLYLFTLPMSAWKHAASLEQQPQL
jgi:CDP-diacylglycerol---serine O-phosphatidyltransferase